MSKKLTYNNVKYKSVFEFYNLNQEDIDVTYEELLKNIRNNIPIDLAIKKQPRKKTASKHGPYIVEGEEYLNMPDLAKEYGINPNTIYKRYERGKRGDDLIPLNKRKKYIKPINAKKYRYYIQGKGFNSKPEMCEYFGIKYTTYRKRIEKGLTEEQALGIVITPDLRYKTNLTRSKKQLRKASDVDLTVYGTTYDSISALARTFKIKDITLRKRILNQLLTPEEAIELEINRNNQDIIAFGKTYKSYSSLAKEYGLNTHVVYNRIKNLKYSPEEAVSKPSTQKVVVNNKEFNSKAEAARYYGKVPENVQSLVRKGATLEQALGLEPIKEYKYEWNKKQFTSKRELADYVSKNTGISSKLIKSRLNKGMSIDEVISLGNKKITNPGRYNLTILERDIEESNKNAFIYFVEINFDSQKFYKVGITTQDVEKRLVNYDHNIISTREGKLIDMYKLEQLILHQYENKKIYDKFDKYTDGITEFLDLNINDVEKINSLINTS